MGLDGGDGDGVDDIVYGAASAEVVDGFFQPLQNGADGDGSGFALNGFVGVVARVEVREDQHGGFSGHFRVGHFLGSHGGIDGGVVLDRAFQQQVGAAFAGNLGGLAYPFHIFPLARVAGGVGEQGDFGFHAKGTGGVGGGDGDFCQLFCRGIGVDGAVAVDQDAML